MCWKNLRHVLMTCSAAAVLLGAPSGSRADCALMDWLFGNGRTTYAPPYTPPAVYAPVAPAGGCTPAPCATCQPACQPACQSCAPTATYRISYRPVPTVAYMPVVGLDPYSGCTVTSYQPTRAWTYQVGYAPVPVAPCSGYSTSYSGCSSCGASCGCSSCGTSYGGCSSCSAGVSSTYVTSGGCSSCASTRSAHIRHADTCPGNDRRAKCRTVAALRRARPDLCPRLACGADLAQCARCDQRQSGILWSLLSHPVLLRRGQPRRRAAADSRRAADPRRSAT